jgi:hypothetical protein
MKFAFQSVLRPVHAISPMHIESFFDPTTFTFSHLLADLAIRQCALIDSVLDSDPKSGSTSNASADQLEARMKALDLQLQ